MANCNDARWCRMEIALFRFHHLVDQYNCLAFGMLSAIFTLYVFICRGYFPLVQQPSLSKLLSETGVN
jgi:hypothetical protein